MVSAYSVRNSAAVSKVLAKAGGQEEEKGIRTIKGSETSVCHGLYTEKSKGSPENLLNTR